MPEAPDSGGQSKRRAGQTAERRHAAHPLFGEGGELAQRLSQSTIARMSSSVIIRYSSAPILTSVPA